MGMDAGKQCGFGSVALRGTAIVSLALALLLAFVGSPAAFAEETGSNQPDEGSAAVSSVTYNGGAVDTTWFFRHLDSRTYVISTPAQLNGFAYLTTQEGYYNQEGQLVESDEEGAQKVSQSALAGKRVELANDIDMTGYTWDRPISYTGTGTNGRHGFSGVFDGQGYTVKNLSGALGLFGVVEEGIVQNVTVELSAVCKSNPTQTSSALGGVVSNLSSGSVYDCAARGNIEFAASWSHDSNRVGGVVGVVTSAAPTTAEDGTLVPAPASQIVGCVFEGTLKGNCGTVGGILGKMATSRQNNQALVDRCINKGSVVSDYAGVATAYVGGIVGAGSFAGSLQIERCANVGTVESKQYQYAAGIVSSPFGSDVAHTGSASAQVNQCYNAGTVTSRQYAAGIVATDRGDVNEECLVISNCYSFGQLTGRSANRTGGITINKNGEVRKTVVNCYYLQGTAGSGIAGSADIAGSCESFAASAASRLADKLGEGFVPDTAERLNAGFPLLAWQLPGTRYAADFAVSLSDSKNDDGAAPTVSVDGAEPVTMQGNAAEGYSLRMEGLSQGQHSYIIEKRGYRLIESKMVVYGGDQTVARLLEQTSYRISFATVPSDAIVELHDAQGYTYEPTSRDARAGVTVFDLPNGEYEYRVHAYGYEQVENRQARVDFADESIDVQLVALPAATLTVDVVSSAGLAFDGNDPLVDVLYEGSVVSCETGSHQEIPVKQGTLTLRVKAANHAVFENTIEIAGDQTVMVSLPLQGAWDGSSRDYTWYEHHIDASDYFIRTPEDLAAFALMVRGGESFEGKTVSLLGDIDLGGVWWTGIGTIENPFMGTFYGGGHKIAGLSIDSVTPRNEDTETEDQANERKMTSGLFDCVKTGSVRNLEVEGSIVTDTGNTESRNGVGMVVGRLTGASLENCSASGSIDGSGTGVYSIGMVCGQAQEQATIALCESKGAINVAAGNGTGIGGILGDGRGIASISDCASATNIMYERTSSWGNSYCGVGGIVGTTGIYSFIVSRCENTGSLTANLGGVGGIVGYAPASSGSDDVVENCTNAGSVSMTDSPLSTTEAVAGIVGISGGSAQAKSLTLSACANRGNVSASTSGDSAMKAAGVLGSYGSVPAVLEACYNTGEISIAGKTGSVAGVVLSGDNKVKLTSCYNAGVVSSTAESVKPYGISANPFANVDAAYCYYREGAASQAFGTDFGSSSLLGSRTEMQMKAAAFVELLNRGINLFKEDERFENGGYPVLGLSRSKYLLYSDVEFETNNTYTGEPINPIKRVNGADGKALVENVDYSLKYLKSGQDISADKSVDASTAYQVVVQGLGDYRGTVTIPYRILPKELDASLFDEIGQVPYSGVEIDLASLVHSSTLKLDTDYTVNTVSGFDYVSVGDQTLSVKGKGNYTGTVELLFRIVSGGVFIDAVPDVEFTNANPKLRVAVRDAGGNLLAPGTDYELSYEDEQGHELALSDVRARGAYAVKAVGKGNYGGEARAWFSIVQAKFTVDDVLEVVATGDSVAPDLIVRNAGNASELLSAGTQERQPDYTLTYKNEKGESITADQVKDPGTYWVTVKGAGRDYRADCEVEKAFKVVSANFRVAAVESLNYTGDTLVPAIRATAVARDEHGDEVVLKEGRDYTVSYKREGKSIDAKDIIEEGEYQAIIAGMGSYFGEFERSVVVKPGAISLDDVPSVVYSGVAQPVSVVVRDANGKQLSLGVDYTVEYFRDGISIDPTQVVSAGSYGVVVNGCGHYTGSQTKSFEVNKASLSVGDIASASYNAGTQVPAVKVFAGSSELPRGRYTVTYYRGEDIVAPRDLVNAGTYNVVAVPTAGTENNYLEGAREARAVYTIDKANVTISAGSMHYYNEDLTPKVTVKVGDTVLSPTLYEVKASRDGVTWLPTVRQAGVYQVAVTMRDPSNFKASVNYGTLEVQKAKVSITFIGKMPYTGSPVQPTVELYYWGKRADGTFKQVDASEYTVSYENSDGRVIDSSEVVAAGSYKVLLTFDTNNYEEGVVTGDFEISPPGKGGNGGSSSGSSSTGATGPGNYGKVSSFVGREATKGSDAGAGSPDLTTAVSIADAAAAYDEYASATAAEGKYDAQSAQARQGGQSEAEALAAPDASDPMSAVGEAIDELPAWLKVLLLTIAIAAVCAVLCTYDYRKARKLAREVEALR